MHVRVPRQPGIRTAADADDLAAVVGNGCDGGAHLHGLAAVGDADDHIARPQLSAGAVDRLGAVQEIGGHGDGGHEGSAVLGHVGGLPDAGDVDSVASVVGRDQKGQGGGEVVLIQFLDELSDVLPTIC